MGNKICCEESHTKPGEIQRLEEEVIQNVVIVDRSDEKNQEPYVAQEQFVEEPEKVEEKVEEPHHEHPHPHENQHKQVAVEIPPLWPRVRDVIEKHRFFESEEAAITAHNRKYGEDVYVGELDEERVRPHGLGRMYKEDRSLFIGHFSHGKAHGKGAFIFNNGSFYNGEFQNNKAETSEGEGKYESQTLKYTGGFQNNTFHGFGKQIGESHQFQGHYSKGARTNGRLVWKAADGQYEYKGGFNIHNKFQGKGLLVEPQGSYDGDFVDGEKHGQGFYRSKAGGYRGDYSHNQRTGKGIIYNPDDTIFYKGEVKNGLPHGKGSAPVPKGNGFIESMWEEGIDVSLMP